MPISTIQYLNNLRSKRIKRGQKLLITQAVNTPSMPITEVQKVDYDKTAERNEKQDIALEPLQKVENTPSNKVVPQQRTLSNQPISSQKSESKEDAQVVREEMQQAELQPKSKHKVTAGESLFSIARKYNLTVDQLKAMNNLSSNTIQAGQMLVVGVSNEVSVSGVTPKTASVESAVHRVRRGDTLYSIARQYGCSVNDLRKWNPGLSDAIRIGESIRIAE